MSPAQPAAPTGASQLPRRVAVVGGGITGLAAAHRLRELAPSTEVTLWEAAPRLGGVLGTERRDGFLIERSADMFTTRDPWALDLCRRIGLLDELIETDARYRRAFVVHRGRLIPVPAGFTLLAPARVWPVLKTPLLSWPGKLRLAAEYLVPRRASEEDESLAGFARRRLGNEAFQRLIQPLVGGIYTADPEKLSMAATMSQFVELERRHGGLIRGMRRGGLEHKPATRDASGARYGMFVAPRDGMGRLIDGVVARLEGIEMRLGARIQQLEPRRLAQEDAVGGQPASDPGRGSGENLSTGGLAGIVPGGWRVIAEGGERQEYEGLILATPAPVAARLLADVHRPLATKLGAIEQAGAAVVVLGLRRDQLQHPLDGFGFVVPRIEGRRILAGSFSSIKFAGRAPKDHVLMRIFVGGALQPELLQRDDRELTQLALEELADLLGLRGEPLFSQVVRWHGTMPQYHVGHLEQVRRIERDVTELPSFALCGNAYRGVGIPFCVRDGERAAEQLLGVSTAATLEAGAGSAG